MSNFIGGYPQITEVGGDDLLPVIQDGELKNATRNSVLGYKTFLAYFTQSGTDAPIIDEIYNDTGRTFTPAYLSAGNYEVDISGDNLLLNKIQFILTGNADQRRVFTIDVGNNQSIFYIYTQSVSAEGDLSYDNSLLRGWIEIRVYN
jgi:hypothetical protein